MRNDISYLAAASTKSGTGIFSTGYVDRAADYVAASGIATFADEELSTSLIISIINDFASEQDQQFELILDSGLQTESIVTITIIDDDVDIFGDENVVYTIEENNNIGDIIGTLGIDFVSPSVTVNVALVECDNVMELSNDLELLALKIFDRERTPIVTCIVEAERTNLPGVKDKQTITLKVTDQNDNTPSFATCVNSPGDVPFPRFYHFPNSKGVPTVIDNLIFYNEEVESGTLIAHLFATDPDLNQNGALKYSVTDKNNEPSTLFSIDENNGKLTALVKFDLEDPSCYSPDIFAFCNDQYTIIVKATDNGGLNARIGTTEIRLIIQGRNEFDPVFDPAVINIGVEEELPDGAGHFVTRVEATDADYLDGRPLYAIIGGNDNDVFKIDRETGVVTTTRALDREVPADQFFDLLIEATQKERSSAPLHLMITTTDINDNDVFFPAETITADPVPEETDGAYVTTIEATDPDASSKIIYTLSGSEYFVIDEYTGVITVTGRIDADTQPRTTSFEVVVTARDADRPNATTASTTVHIPIADINDNVPEVIYLLSNINISETSPVGETIVGAVGITDKDGPPSPRLRTDSEFFTANPDGSLSTKKVLDFETRETYVVVIHVDDSNQGVPSWLGPDVETTVRVRVLDVNDEPPVFPAGPREGTVRENSPAGTEVLTFQGSDADLQSSIQYSIVAGNTGDMFKIVDNKLVINRKLGPDREIPSEASFDIDISAQDTAASGTQIAFRKVMITVLDENDNTPIFSPHRTVADIEEGDTNFVTTDILRLEASDADGAEGGTNPNGMLYFSTSNPDFYVVSVAEDACILRATRAFDNELPSDRFHAVVVRVSDGADGELKRFSETTINVSVTNVNEETPTFPTAPYTVTVGERDVGATSLTIEATDSDGGTFGVVTYKLVKASNVDTGTDASNLFSIRSDGKLLLTTPINDVGTGDYTLGDYLLEGSGTDGGGKTGTCTILVKVADVNDNLPTFNSPSFFGEVDEVAVIGDLVSVVGGSDFTFFLEWTDLDTDENNKDVVFSLSSVSGSHLPFSVSADGRIIVDGSLTRPAYPAVYDLKVTIVNKAGYYNGDTEEIPGQSATLTITVNVLNHETPTFDKIAYTLSVSEGVVRDDEIASEMYVTDNDTGKYGDVYFTIINGNVGGAWGVKNYGNTFSLVVDRNEGIDREKISSYNLTIKASDRGEPNAKHSTALLTLRVTDINDNFARFKKERYTIILSEYPPTANEVLVGCCKEDGTDSDVAPYDEFGYDISNQDLFRIDSETGEITVREDLDFDNLAVARNYTFDVYTRQTYPLAKGAGAATGIGQVTVILRNANDNFPVITSSSSVTLSEDYTDTLTPFFEASATDIDGAEFGPLKFSLESINTPFQMSEEGGLYLKSGSVLNRDIEGGEAYNLSIVVRDGGSPPKETKGFVFVTISDVNDESPIFLAGTEAFMAINEEEPINSVVGSADAFDADAPNSKNSAIVYTLQDDSGFFTIDRFTGEIRTTVVIDRETIVNDTVFAIVTATDLGPDSKPTRLIVNIVIRDVDDHEPLFTLPVYAFHLEEEAPAGIIGQVLAVDGDKPQTVNSEVRYKMVNLSDSRFSINAIGEISTTTPIDREIDGDSIVLHIVAYDMGDVQPQTFETASVVVTIKDIDDNAPSFGMRSYAFYVIENAPPGKFGVVSATDLDASENRRITYRVVSGNDENLFDIDKNNGELRTKKMIPWTNKKNSFSLTIRADDNGEVVSNVTTAVTITIKDINNNSPQFTTAALDDIHLLEDTDDSRLNELVRTVSATDLDNPAENGNGAVTFEIDPNVYFDLSSNGELTKKTFIDRNIVQSITLHLYAMDGPGRVTSGVVNVIIDDINNRAPVFVNAPYTFTFAEEQGAGAFVGRVEVDQQGDVAETLKYSILASNPVIGLTLFSIDTDGNIFSSELLDREQAVFKYELTVSVSDSKFADAITTVLVSVSDVNDNAPVISVAAEYVDLPEDLPVGSIVDISGKQILSASDKDVDSVVTWSLLRVEPVGVVDQNTFEISSNGNIILLKNLARDGSNSSPRYEVHVVASDQVHEVTGSFMIFVTDVNDEAPIFVAPSNLFYTIEEHTAPGHPIVTVRAIDADYLDVNHEVRYSIAGELESAAFTIDSISGNITVRDSSKVDREVWDNGQVKLNVWAMDTGSPSLKTSVLITVTLRDINDKSPVIVVPDGGIIGSVVENLPSGQKVLTVIAHDDDDQSTDNSQLQYFFDSNISGPIPFSIERDTGVITTTKSINAEDATTYRFGIIVRDRGVPANVVSSEVKITVHDLNDESPVFEFNDGETYFSADIPENSERGTEVVTFTVRDADATAVNRNSSFSITSPVDVPFRVLSSGVTGTIIVDGDIDFDEGKKTYSLLISVVNIETGTEIEATESATVILTVIDVNDEAPIFTGSSSLLWSPDENSFPETFSGVKFSDFDTNSKVVYSIESPNTIVSEHVDINNITGELMLLHGLDFEVEEQRSFSLSVIAKDRDGPASNPVTVNVEVTDGNDELPEVEVTPVGIPITVVEGAEAGVVVLGPGADVRLRTNDNDATSKNQLVNYTLSGIDSSSFAINASNGYLTTSGELIDREKSEELSISVCVKNIVLSVDNGILSSCIDLLIKVIDINDNAPLFKSSAGFIVNEDALVGDFVGTVLAVDNDKINTDNSRVVYSLAGESSGSYSINEDSGEITVADVLRWEDLRGAPVYLTVVARDFTTAHGGLFTGETSKVVSIQIRDTNNYSPVFSQPEGYFYTVSELHSSEHAIGDPVIAVDKDDAATDGNGLVTYSVNNQMFRIEQDGTIYLAAESEFDADTESSRMILFTTRATDGGGRFSEVNISISVTDANDMSPVFGDIGVLQVLENAAANTIVGSVLATDADKPDTPNSQLSYTSSDSRFTINSDGQLRVALDATISRENDGFVTDSIPLKVFVTDAGIPPRSAEIDVEVMVIDVNDEKPYFTSSEESTISELASPGTAAATLTAEDADSNAAIAFDILDVTAGGDSLFILRGTNPATIELTGALDRSLAKEYIFTIRVYNPDDENYATLQKLTIYVANVNLHAPQFEQTSPIMLDLPESFNVGEKIGAVIANDEDDGRNGVVTYRISSQSKGLISVAEDGSLLLAKKFSLEDPAQDFSNRNEPMYTVTVIAVDNAADSADVLFSEIDVVLTVKDADNSPPVFIGLNDEQVLMIDGVRETVSVGTIVASVTTRDNDIDFQDPPKFEVITAIGIRAGVDVFLERPYPFMFIGNNLSTTTALDFETFRSFNLVVDATDGGGNTNRAKVTIPIINENDELMIFDAPTMTVSAPEGRGFEVLLQVNDRDLPCPNLPYLSDSFCVIYPSYRVVASDISHRFSIQASGKMTAFLKHTSALDFESDRSLTVVIEVTDDPSDWTRAAQVAVTINVIPGNEFPPQFERSSYSVTISELAAPGSLVTFVVATDGDSKDTVDGQFVYTIETVGQPFSVNSTGAITTTGVLDFEMASSITLQLIATDGAGLEDRAQVVITLVNENDMDPQFSTTYYTGSVVEELPAGQPIGTTVVATDLDECRYGADVCNMNDDSHGTISYSIAEGLGSSMFIIDANGVIRTASEIDRETDAVDGFIMLTVIARDGGGRKSAKDATVAVEIIDQPDNNPTFTQDGRYFFSVTEGLDSGAFVGKVYADDKDSTDKTRLYSFVDSTGPFRIGELTGEITTTENIDRESVKDFKYNLRVKATDSYGKAGYAAVEIIIEDVNDNHPKFSSDVYNGTVSEGADIGIAVTTFGTEIVVTDEDAVSNGVTKYWLEGDFPDGIFEIGAVTVVDIAAGTTKVEVIVSDALDRDNCPGHGPVDEERCIYRVTIYAVDNDTSSPGHAVIFIDLTDINNKPPVFAEEEIVVFFSEDTLSVSGAVSLGGQSATDADSRDQIGYSFAKEQDQSFGISRFVIDPKTGMISLGPDGPGFDREEYDTHVLSIIATDLDNTALTGSYRFIVYVEDVNDEAPFFVEPPAAKTVTDGSIPQDVLTVSAKDWDCGDNAMISFVLSGATADVFTLSTPVRSPSDITSACSETGYVWTSVLSASATIDRETHGDTLDLTVTAVGPEFTSSPMRVTIAVEDINDNQPYFNDSERTFYVTESVIPAPASDNQPWVDGILGEVTATDIDKDGTSRLEYSLAGGISDSGENTDHTKFKISSTGEITPTSQFDRESQEKYVFRVIAFDPVVSKSIQTASTIVTVIVNDVNDWAPYIKSGDSSDKLYLEVNEDHDVSIPVDNLNKYLGDKDKLGPNSELQFTITADTHNAFMMKSIGGELFLTEKLERDLALGGESEHTIGLQVQNTGACAVSICRLNIFVTIMVKDANDNKPVFTNSTPYACSILEEKASSSCTTVNAIDNDEDLVFKSIRYTFTHPHEKFYINPGTGEITSIGPLNWEDEKFHMLQVVATDGGGLSATTDVFVTVLDINDHPPIPDQELWAATVMENAAFGTEVTRITVSDLDDTNHKSNAVSTFRFKEPNDFFTINSTNGLIAVKMSTSLNYEVSTEHRIEVVATNGDFEVYGIMVIVTVVNVNDVSPIFLDSETRTQVHVYNASLSEFAPSGMTVTRVMAVDGDAPNEIDPSNFVSYSLKTFSDKFNIDSYSGFITTNSKLEVQTYDIVVVATDSGINPGSLSTEVTVTLSVSDENNNDPTFTEPVYHANISENTEVGGEVIQILATDKDSGVNKMITYSIVSGEDYFDIDPKSGMISLVQRLHAEVKRQHTAVFKAADQGVIPRTAVVVLIVNVIDVNNYDPVISGPTNPVVITEEQGSIVVATVTSSDADATEENKAVFYELEEETSGLFVIDNISGIITTTGPLDREIASTHSINVRALNVIDRRSGALSMTIITVKVNDINDESPVCNSDLRLIVKVSESKIIGDVVGTFRGTDNDEAGTSFSTINYALKGLGQNIFSVDNEGTLFVAAPLDYESTTKRYNLSMELTDGGGKVVECPFTIALVDIGDWDNNTSDCRKFAVSHTDCCSH